MNILLSVNNMGLGGVTTYMAHLATGLSKNHKVVIFDHYPYSSDYKSIAFIPESICIESVLSHPLRDKINWKIASVLKKLGISSDYWHKRKQKYFNKILKKYDIQLITSFDKYSDKQVVDAIGDKIPLVLSVHGSYDISEYYSIPDDEIQLYEPVFRTARAIIYKAECNVRILKKYDNLVNLNTVKRIFHGFTAESPSASSADIRKKLGIKSKAFVFGMIARGVPEKGWLEAIQAFLKVKNTSDKDIHFIAVGDSDYLETLKMEFETEKSIHFTGFVEDSMDWVNAFDVGVLPTYAPTENFTFSIVEYMFCGKPTIASDHGEISVTIDADGERAGILITNINGKPDVNGISEAMKLYLSNELLYKKHKALTKKALQKFSSEKAIADYEEVFKLVIDSHTNKD